MRDKQFYLCRFRNTSNLIEASLLLTHVSYHILFDFVQLEFPIQFINKCLYYRKIAVSPGLIRYFFSSISMKISVDVGFLM